MNRKISCLEPSALESFLERRRRSDTSFPSEASLAAELSRILEMSSEFVPSEAGSILLDDPGAKEAGLTADLTFIAAFGDKAPDVVGRTMRTSEGIAGHVYRQGCSHVTSRAREDELFYSRIDDETTFRTGSLIAIPIRLGDEVCGVLELLRAEPYQPRDCELLEIFARYISVAMQNVLDARYAQAIAKRDNLTSLYNDRYLHIALEEQVAKCLRLGTDLTLLFLDLDYFKRINDSHGHLAGSQVLREVGGILAEMIGDRGLPARYGGDEFVVVLPGCSLAEGVELAEDVRIRVLSTTFCAEASDIQPRPLYLRGLASSIGAASLKHHIDSNEKPDVVKTALLHLADAAMYVAKETGRNRTAVAAEPVTRRRSVTATQLDNETERP